MNLVSLKNIGGPGVQKAVLKLSKWAPEILTGVGILGVVGGTILIARAATKLEPIVDQHEFAVAQNKENQELALMEDVEVDFTVDEVKRDLVRIYLRTALRLGKEFGPGVSIQVASIVSILAAHGIMKRRNVALLGAYKAVEAAFVAYRQRVIEEYGEDVDKDFRLGFRKEKITDEATGKTKTVYSIDPNHISRYARWFDEGNDNWVKSDPQYNLAFLKNHQNWMNDRLRINGFLFLNDVYRDLGFEETPEGQLVGWVMSAENGGDLHVDFNMYTADSIGARKFINGEESRVLLDFNVDGVILDLIQTEIDIRRPRITN